MFTFAFLLAVYSPLFPHLVLYSAAEQHFHRPSIAILKLQSHTLTGISKQNVAPTVSDNDNVCICCFSFTDPQSKCQRRFSPVIPDASSHSTKFSGFSWKNPPPQTYLTGVIWWCDENRCNLPVLSPSAYIFHKWIAHYVFQANKRKRTMPQRVQPTYNENNEKPIKEDAVFHRLLTTDQKDARRGRLQRTQYTDIYLGFFYDEFLPVRSLNAAGKCVYKDAPCSFTKTWHLLLMHSDSWKIISSEKKLHCGCSLRKTTGNTSPRNWPKTTCFHKSVTDGLKVTGNEAVKRAPAVQVLVLAVVNMNYEYDIGYF